MALPCSTIDCLNEICTLLYNDFYSYQSQTDLEIRNLEQKNVTNDGYFNQIYEWANTGALRQELDDIKKQISDNKTEMNGYINGIYDKLDDVDNSITNLNNKLSEIKKVLQNYRSEN